MDYMIDGYNSMDCLWVIINQLNGFSVWVNQKNSLTWNVGQGMVLYIDDPWIIKPGVMICGFIGL